MRGNDSTWKFVRWRSISVVNLAISQLLIPFIFILQSDLHQFGVWVAVNSYSGFISFLDFGLFAVIPTNAISKNSHDLTFADRMKLTALRKYSFRLCSLLILFLLSLLVLGRYFGLRLVESDFFLYAVLSAINGFLVFLLRYFEASFRSISSHYGFAILTVQAIATTMSTAIILLLHGSILSILVINLTISMVLLLHYRLRGDAFNSLTNSQASVSYIFRKFAKQGVGFLFFPVGYMLINQGIVIIIQYLGNYQVIGTLATIRAVAGLFRQITGIFTASTIPNLALLMKNGDVAQAQKTFIALKKLNYQVNSAIFFVLFFVALFFLSQGVLVVNHIPVLICLLFVISAAFDIPWNVWLTVSLAVNEIHDLGRRFLFSSFVTLVITFLGFPYFGIAGIPFWLLSQDIIMTRQVIHRGKKVFKFFKT